MLMFAESMLANRTSHVRRGVQGDQISHRLTDTKSQTNVLASVDVGCSRLRQNRRPTVAWWAPRVRAVN